MANDKEFSEAVQGLMEFAIATFRKDEVYAGRLISFRGQWVEIHLQVSPADPPSLPVTPWDFIPADTEPA